MLPLPKWLGIKYKEILSSLVILELDENRSLEELIRSAAEANCVCGSIRSEESFNIELRARLLVAEALNIDRSGLGLRTRSVRIVGNLALHLLLSFRASDFKE